MVFVSQYLSKNTKDCYVSIEKLHIEEKKTFKKHDTAYKENDTVTNLNIRKNDSPSNLPPAKRYMTRRSAALNADNQMSLPNIQQTTRARAATQPRQPPSFIEYKGKVEYYTHFVDIAVAADTLL